MDYLGNKKLLELKKTAFLASSTIPTDMVLRCYDWAQEKSRGKQCIIGYNRGLFFSSGKERPSFPAKRNLPNYPCTCQTDV